MTSSGNIAWSGVVTSVQPRIRLTRAFDQRRHTYQGYVLRVRGSVGGEACCSRLERKGVDAVAKRIEGSGAEQTIGKGNAPRGRSGDCMITTCVLGLVSRRVEPRRQDEATMASRLGTLTVQCAAPLPCVEVRQSSPTV